MTVNELVAALETLRARGLGEADVILGDEFGSVVTSLAADAVAGTVELYLDDVPVGDPN